MVDAKCKIGIMGGTFDPVHYGHLVTAEAALGEFQLDQVLFVPSGNPPHKDPIGVTETKHRYLMTVLATVTNPKFEVSRVDIDREGVTYTIETLRLLKARYGPGTELYFITGADAILEIMSWKDPKNLLQMAEFIAATRPGFSLGRQNDMIKRWFAQQEKSLNILQVPAMAISSTDIRKRVKHGKSIRYLVPETVDHYIYKNNLYGECSGTHNRP